MNVDTDGDGELADESPLLLNLDSTVTVNVRRRWANGKTTALPYILSYSRPAAGREAREVFHLGRGYKNRAAQA